MINNLSQLIDRPIRIPDRFDDGTHVLQFILIFVHPLCSNISILLSFFLSLPLPLSAYWTIVLLYPMGTAIVHDLLVSLRAFPLTGTNFTRIVHQGMNLVFRNSTNQANSNPLAGFISIRSCCTIGTAHSLMFYTIAS